MEGCQSHIYSWNEGCVHCDECERVRKSSGSVSLQLRQRLGETGRGMLPSEPISPIDRLDQPETFTAAPVHQHPRMVQLLTIVST